MNPLLLRICVLILFTFPCGLSFHPIPVSIRPNNRHSTGWFTPSPTSSTAVGQQASSPLSGLDRLTPEIVASMIERTFVQACIQLAEGYVDILKLFIAATKAGYERQIDPSELIRLVDNDPQQSAGRPLTDDECALRANWIQVIYLTLQHLHWKDLELGWALDDHLAQRYGDVLPTLVDDKKSGRKLDVNALLSQHPSIVRSDSVVERAITGQSLRVMWVTMDVVADEELAKPRTPRPKIPGAFD